MSLAAEFVQLAESLVFSVFFLLLLCCVTAVLASSCSEYLHKRQGAEYWQQRQILFFEKFCLYQEIQLKIFLEISRLQTCDVYQDHELNWTSYWQGRTALLSIIRRLTRSGTKATTTGWRRSSWLRSATRSMCRKYKISSYKILCILSDEEHFISSWFGLLDFWSGFTEDYLYVKNSTALSRWWFLQKRNFYQKYV